MQKVNGCLSRMSQIAVLQGSVHSQDEIPPSALILPGEWSVPFQQQLTCIFPHLPCIVNTPPLTAQLEKDHFKPETPTAKPDSVPNRSGLFVKHPRAVERTECLARHHPQY